jgi:hypothetical protein
MARGLTIAINALKRHNIDSPSERQILEEAQRIKDAVYDRGGSVLSHIGVDREQLAWVLAYDFSEGVSAMLEYRIGDIVRNKSDAGMSWDYGIVTGYFGEPGAPGNGLRIDVGPNKVRTLPGLCLAAIELAQLPEGLKKLMCPMMTGMGGNNV